ncbi:MAG: tetratricopeptide repeat protein [Planctomycetota bacterium]
MPPVPPDPPAVPAPDPGDDTDGDLPGRTIPAPARRARNLPTRLPSDDAVTLPTPPATRRVPQTVAPGPTAAGREFGRYQLRQELGRGGMGSVQLAFDPEIRREVALKVILGKRTQPDVLARFIQEAQVTGQLEHPNIVPVHELGYTSDGRPYFTMKVVRGESLRARLDRLRQAVMDDGPAGASVFPLGDRLDVLAKVGDALAFAHEHGVLHRDLKPENVMIGRFGEVQLMDWGLARVIGRPAHALPAVNASLQPPRDPRARISRRQAPPQEQVASDDDIASADTLIGSAWQDGGAMVQTDGSDETARLTMDGDVAGTPSYMSPEQANGDIAAIDARTDIFSLGAILYELLALDAPYRGETTMETVLLAAKGQWEPVRSRIHDDWGRRWTQPPRELVAILGKAMARNPKRRYANMPAMVADLRRYAAHEPVSALPDGPVSRLLKWMRRRPTTALGLGVAVVGGLIVSVLAVLLYSSNQAAELMTARAAQATAEAARHVVESEQARAREQLAAGKVDELKITLGIRVDTARGKVLQNLATAWAQRPASMPPDRFFRELGADRVQECAAAFDLLMRAAASDTGVTITADDHLLMAMLYQYGKLDPPAALPMFDQAVALAPDNVAIVLARSDCRAATGDIEGALTDCTRAGRLEPENARVWLTRAAAYSLANNRAAAMADLDTALGFDPALGEALLARGLIYLAEEKYEQADKDFTESIRVSPMLAIAWVQHGRLFQRMGDGSGALHDFTQAISIDPTLHDGYYYRAMIRMRTGEYDLAEADFDKALELFDSVPGRVNRGICRNHQEKFGPAVDDLTIALRRAPDMRDALWWHSIASENAGKRDDGLADLNRLVRLFPDDPSILRQRAMIHGRNSDWAAARADLDLCVLVAPTFRDGWADRAAMRSNQNDLVGAISDIEQALKIDPGNALAWRNKASMLNKTGRHDDAMEAISQAIRFAPNDPGYWRWRGVARMQDGDLPGALSDYNRVLELSPDDVGARMDRARLHSRLNNPAGVAADLERVVAMQPRDWTAWIGLARAQVQLNRREQAISAYRNGWQVAPAEQRAMIEGELRELGSTPR